MNNSRNIILKPENIRKTGRLTVIKKVSMKVADLWVLGFALLSVSCGGGQDTPVDTNHLAEFHQKYFADRDEPLKVGLRLFVDYSTCCALGQNSRFFQEVSASLVDRTTDYYAVQGPNIEKVEIEANGGVYTLLRNISEVNYAELARAAGMAADGNCEAVMLTDAEYYTPSIAKGHDNDPYLAPAFKEWILKGHDIHIISEPYIESYKGNTYNKKRFYILFTDDRMPNNIYSRITRTVDLRQYPEIDEFHISASHPVIRSDRGCSIQNELLQSKCVGYGDFEIQDWQGCDWRTIEDCVIYAPDTLTGAALPNGDRIIRLGVSANSFGCYRINDLELKVYDINAGYNDFYNSKETGKPTQGTVPDIAELDGFMLIDKDEFNRHSLIDIYFNQMYFDPSLLIGKPYNYLKLDICVNGIEEIFSRHEDKFVFESIGNPGMKNVSVASSIRQCLADSEVIKKMMGQVIYSIYIKSEQK